MATPRCSPSSATSCSNRSNIAIPTAWSTSARQPPGYGPRWILPGTPAPGRAQEIGAVVYRVGSVFAFARRDDALRHRRTGAVEGRARFLEVPISWASARWSDAGSFDGNQRGGPYVAMIGEVLRRTRFAADPHINGNSDLRLDPRHHRRGPSGRSRFPDDGVDVWAPRPSEWSILPSRYWAGITVLNGFCSPVPRRSHRTGWGGDGRAQSPVRRRASESVRDASVRLVLYGTAWCRSSARCCGRSPGPWVVSVDRLCECRGPVDGALQRPLARIRSARVARSAASRTRSVTAGSKRGPRRRGRGSRIDSRVLGAGDQAGRRRRDVVAGDAAGAAGRPGSRSMARCCCSPLRSSSSPESRSAWCLPWARRGRM